MTPRWLTRRVGWKDVDNAECLSDGVPAGRSPGREEP